MAAANNPANQKMQNLPLLCVESICKFTPTCKLARLCSVAVPLPGAWSLGLETVLEKRLPLRDDHPYRLHAKALYDGSGAKVASIKKPEAFQFSPICEFVESATLYVEVVSLIGGPLQFYAVHGDALLSHLPNVIHLELDLDDTQGYCESKDLLAPCLLHLLPRLQSFSCRSDVSYQIDEAFGNLIAARIGEMMSRLRRLALPVTSFHSLMRSADRSSRLQAVLAGLSSLASGREALRLVTLRCRQLSQLKIEVRGEFRAYLAAFRELPRLSSLALDVRETDFTGLTFDGRDAIDLVSHLRIIFGRQFSYYYSAYTDDVLIKIATFFPNVRSVEVDAESLDLATSLFSQAQLFPVAAMLVCFYPPEALSYESERLMQFLANSRLPEAVDLSQIILNNLVRDAGLLTDIYCAMQSNSIKSLSLSGPVHSEALARLHGHIHLKGENSTKVFAWKDRDLGDQPGINLHFPTEISEQTDFKIGGKKTAGNLKDEEFTIRVFHQLAKRGTGSWYFSMT